jgi:HJR/Mrr/RecB family endonuclease
MVALKLEYVPQTFLALQNIMALHCMALFHLRILDIWFIMLSQSEQVETVLYEADNIDICRAMK